MKKLIRIIILFAFIFLVGAIAMSYYIDKSIDKQEVDSVNRTKRTLDTSSNPTN